MQTPIVNVQQVTPQLWLPARRSNVFRKQLSAGLLLGAAIMLSPLSHAYGTSYFGKPEALELSPSEALYNEMYRSTAQSFAATGKSTGFSLAKKPTRSYNIRKGDTLSNIFRRLGISQKQMYQVLEADVEILALDTLKPGNTLHVWFNKSKQLQALELSFSKSHKVRFERVDSNNFVFAEENNEGQWQPQTYKGTIQGSFYLSAKRAGLSSAHINSITKLLDGQVDFKRNLRNGDRFEVVVSQPQHAAKNANKARVDAIRLYARGRVYSAYLNDDGNYYDQDGNGLVRGFLRVPLLKDARISSHFNPRRKHPVTGLVRPHNGTDFAIPIGTPIIAPSDGVVTRIENHVYAGKYLVIEHEGQFRTRYLHLNTIKVKKGQRVKQGQVIAESGNTGRSTGAHLHYELHVKGRPVDPMKAKIPESSAAQVANLSAFKKRVSYLDTILKA